MCHVYAEKICKNMVGSSEKESGCGNNDLGRILERIQFQILQSGYY